MMFFDWFCVKLMQDICGYIVSNFKIIVGILVILKIRMILCVGWLFWCDVVLYVVDVLFDIECSCIGIVGYDCFVDQLVFGYVELDLVCVVDVVVFQLFLQWLVYCFCDFVCDFYDQCIVGYQCELLMEQLVVFVLQCVLVWIVDVGDGFYLCEIVFGVGVGVVMGGCEVCDCGFQD